jgi:hypothetical protein
MVEEYVSSFRIRLRLIKNFHWWPWLPPTQICSGLLSMAPNRTDNGLLGENYAHFKVHLYSSDFIYIDLCGK